MTYPNPILILVRLILDDIDLNPAQRAYNQQRAVCALDYMSQSELYELEHQFELFIDRIEEND